MKLQPLNSTWLRGAITEEEKQHVEQMFRNATTFRYALRDILDNKKKDLTNTNYTSPAWACEQADRLGYNRALNDVLKLINDIEVDNATRSNSNS